MAQSAKATIRAKLLMRTGMSTQGLNRRIGALAKRIAVTSDEALYIVAYENGVSLKGVDSATLALVRQHTAPAAAAPRVPAKASKPAPPRTVSIRIGDVDVGSVPTMSAALAADAKKVAEACYIRLFLIENSLRELITRVMAAAEGQAWWSSVRTPLREKAARYSQNELKAAWHPARGTDPIQFVDLPDLVTIVEDAWPRFEKVFGQKHWLRGFIEDMNITRRVVAHMSKPDRKAFGYIETHFNKWTTLLQNRSQEIP